MMFITTETLRVNIHQVAAPCNEAYRRSLLYLTPVDLWVDD